MGFAEDEDSRLASSFFRSSDFFVLFLLIFFLIQSCLLFSLLNFLCISSLFSLRLSFLDRPGLKAWEAPGSPNESVPPEATHAIQKSQLPESSRPIDMSKLLPVPIQGNTRRGCVITGLV
jgi:hypothetical protein